VVFGVDLRHQHLHIPIYYIILLDVTEDLTETHVTLVDNAQSLLFPRYIDTRSAILGIVVEVSVVFINIVKLEVDPQIGCLLGLDHLLIACLFVIKDIN
jgi:hypothetical protein